MTLVLSDDPKSSSRIGQFAASTDEWMVAVRMVSEGVDVPRLAVGVYATSASTPLFFAQAIGRFVRSRRPGETASVFLPSVPILLAHAAALEAGTPISTITGQYSAAYREDMAMLGVDGEFAPDIEPAATDHIAEIIAMCERAGIAVGGEAQRTCASHALSTETVDW